MIYRQPKSKSKFFVFLPQAVLLAALSALLIWKPAGFFMKSQIIKAIGFVLSDSGAPNQSREMLAMLEKIHLLQEENKKLNDLLGSTTPQRILRFPLSFGGGYLFMDTFFLKKGDESIKTGDWVLKNGVILGKITETGSGFAKFKSIGSLGERATLRVGENKDSVFEAEGIGGGELKVSFPVSLELHAGDPVWWGEDPQYLAGLIEEIRTRETSTSAEIIITVPVKTERLTEVDVLPR